MSIASGPIRIVVAGGGTGGHVLPAVSVIEEFRRRRQPIEILWIGSHTGVERAAAEQLGVQFAAIATGKLRRYLDRKTVVDAFRLPLGTAQAWRLIRLFRPHVVFSTGGFVSVPSVVAASRRAPILTHEQTTVIGLANRINSRFADVFALSYGHTGRQTRAERQRVIVTGNPVRLSLLEGVASRGFERYGFDPRLPLIYVTGGARGSSPINRRIESLLPDILNDCQVLHQAGPPEANDDMARLVTTRSTWSQELQRRYRVVSFVGEELADVYAAASLVIGRAGAGTIAELPLVGKPAILIPLPSSGGAEQDSNAEYLARAGAAVVIPQRDATPVRLRSEINGLLREPGRLSIMAERARSLARPDAAARLADALLDLAKS